MKVQEWKYDGGAVYFYGVKLVGKFDESDGSYIFLYNLEEKDQHAAILQALQNMGLTFDSSEVYATRQKYWDSLTNCIKAVEEFNNSQKK